MSTDTWRGPRPVIAFLVVYVSDLDTIVELASDLLIGPNERRPDDFEFLRLLGDAFREVVPTLPLILEQLEAARPETLSAAGLDGSQIQAKVAAWKRPRERAIEDWTSSDLTDRFAPISEKAFWAGNPAVTEIFRVQDRHMHFLGVERLPATLPDEPGSVMKWLCRALQHGNTIIGSVAGITGPAGEPLREFSQMVQKVMCHAAADR